VQFPSIHDVSNQALRAILYFTAVCTLKVFSER
jgi:hypothetical protein